MNATTSAGSPVLTVGHLTVDDVVLPDGRTRMGSLGGAALYAGIGAQLAGASAQVVSRQGAGMTDERVEVLDNWGIGSQLRAVEQPAIQQWVLYEHDGSRRYVLHPESGSLDGMSPDPSDYSIPKGVWVHLAPMPLEAQLRWSAAIAGNPVTLDPHEDMCEERPQDVLAMLRHLEAFLPSEIEARRLGGGDPIDAAARFRAAGAQIVAVKLGEAGSVVSFGTEMWRVPALRVPVVDVTGAGDAYCGAFAAALSRGESGLEAARWGTVAASYVVESRGADLPSGTHPPDLPERLAAVSGIQIVAGASAGPHSPATTEKGNHHR